MKEIGPNLSLVLLFMILALILMPVSSCINKDMDNREKTNRYELYIKHQKEIKGEVLPPKEEE